jgi:hypothetical protein
LRAVAERPTKSARLKRIDGVRDVIEGGRGRKEWSEERPNLRKRRPKDKLRVPDTEISAAVIIELRCAFLEKSERRVRCCVPEFRN